MRLTDNQLTQLRECNGERWLTPHHMGGLSAGKRSGVLRALCALGLVEWKWRSRGTGIPGEGARGSKLYRLTEAGKEHLKPTPEAPTP